MPDTVRVNLSQDVERGVHIGMDARPASFQTYKRDPQRFNRELRRSRIKIEHVFAKLKTWRSLQGLFAWNWQRYGEVVRAVSVLHNLNKEVATPAK